MKALILVLILGFNVFSHGMNLKKVLEFGSDDAQEYLFFKPGPITVDDEGNIYLVESETQVLRKYDRSGKFISEVGGKGQGPSEFIGIIFLGILGENLLVYDARAKKLSRFDLDLNYLEEKQLPDINLFVTSNGNNLIFNKVNRSESAGNVIAVMNPFDKKQRTVFQEENFGRYEKYRKSPLFSVYFSYRIAVEEKSGSFVATLWYPRSGRPELLFFSQEGEFVRRISVDDIAKGYLLDERLLDMQNFREAQGTRMMIGGILYPDEQRTLLLCSIGKSKDDNDVFWIVVDNFSGKTTGRLPYNEKTDLRYIKNDLAYGYVLDDADAEIKVAVFEIEW